MRWARPRGSRCRMVWSRNRVITTPGHVGAHARLRPPSRGDRQDRLGVGGARRLRQRERAAEAGVDVGDAEDRAVLAKALDRARAGQAERLHGRGAELGELGVVEGLALDLLAALGLDHRPRHGPEGAPVEVAEAVDAELLAGQRPLDDALGGGVAQEEGQLARRRRSGRCGAPRSRGAASPERGRAAPPGRRRPAARSAARAARGRRAWRGRPTCPDSRAPPRGPGGTPGPGPLDRRRGPRQQHRVEVGQRQDGADALAGAGLGDRVAVGGVVHGRQRPARRRPWKSDGESGSRSLTSTRPVVRPGVEGRRGTPARCPRAGRRRSAARSRQPSAAPGPGGGRSNPPRGPL